MMETGTAGEGGGYCQLSHVHNSLLTQINNEDVEKKKKRERKEVVYSTESFMKHQLLAAFPCMSSALAELPPPIQFL